MSSKNSVSGFSLRMMVYGALFTAFIIIGSYISIPIPVGPVPIALADFFVMLTGLFLWWKYGLQSTALYLVLWALGLPVFAGGRAGLGIILGPTGGFLFGYLLMVLAIGIVAGKMKPSIVSYLIALIAGNFFLYLAGIPWLKAVMNMSWPAAVAAGFTPFVIGMVIKIAAAAALARVLLLRFRQTMRVNT